MFLNGEITMKKIFSAILFLVLLCTLAVPVFADLGEAQFKDWYVYCGPDGYDFVDWYMDYDTGEEYSYDAYLQPGTKMQVHNYNDSDATYLLIPDDYSEFKGSGFVFVTEGELNAYFLEEFETVPAERGTRLPSPAAGTVTAQVGLVFRQGPGTRYMRYSTIPYGTKLTYTHTYDAEGMTWAYVSYSGLKGWVSTTYLAEAAAEPAAETTDEVTEESAAADETTLPETTAAETTAPASAGFFGDTDNVIIVCCGGALLVALTALITLLAVRRKKPKQ